MRVAGLAWLLLGGCEWVRLPADDTAYDMDEDGWTSVDDCDDFNERVRPLAPEACNGVDNNCSGDESDARDASLWYADLDGDSFGDPGASLYACDQPLGYVIAPFDCDDTDPAVFQGAPETDCADPVDYNCDGLPAAWDVDGDGWVGCEDCDDASRSTFPGAPEACNGVDDDCDGAVDNGDSANRTWWEDADGDGWGGSAVTMEACGRPIGFSATDTDCDDADPARHPDAAEACDALDNDCDDLVDEPDRFGNDRWYTDADGDGYGDPDAWEASCAPVPGRVAEAGDCDDVDAAVHPDAAETCDEVDQDCDGVVDDTPLDPLPWYRDVDRDGWGNPSVVAEACTQPAGYVDVAGDCDDTDGATHPSAAEQCGGGDEDCDGAFDEDDAVGGGPWYADADGDGWGDDTDVSTTCVAADDRVASGGDCDDADTAYHPGALEIDCVDPADYNCDGSSGRADLDGDGWAACRDCDDADPDRSPSAVETCDGADEDCDGEADEDVADADEWFPDVDADGYGDTLRGVAVCDPPEGYVAAGGDCDDTDAARSPGRDEVCTTATDDDCDGETNRGAVDCAPFYADGDEDTFGADAACLCGAEAPYTAEVDGDCDDGDPAVHPDAAEACGDGVDNDCDDAAYGCGLAGEMALGDADARMTGSAYGNEFGFAAAPVGDLDGDGFADLLVGAPGVDEVGSTAGAAFLLRGPLAPTGTSADATTAWYGESAGDMVGRALAAGDLDGDSVVDLVFGVPFEDTAGDRSGAVYLLLGPSTGGSLADADGRRYGTDTLDAAGQTLAVVPDTDLDGADELAVGAPNESAESGGAGAVYVLDAAPTGTGALADAAAVLTGSAASDYFGRALTGVDDLDGDGLGDLAVGAYAHDGGGTNGGAVYVYLGALSGHVTTDMADAARLGATGESAGFALASGDLDADGYSDLVVGAFTSDLAGTNAGAVHIVHGPITGTSALVGDATLLGEAASDNAGTVLAVGDLDDDGLDDVAVTGEGMTRGRTGAVWVAFGPLAGTLDLGAVEGVVLGEDATDDAGSALAIPGDTDGDGFLDLLITAPGEDDVGGAIYLLSGGPGF